VETIVVGIDSTPESLEALVHAAGVADDGERGLVVVFVRQETHPRAFSASSGLGIASDALDFVQSKVRERAAAALVQHRAHWCFEVRTGEPSSELIAAAQQHRAMTIVVGGRPHGVVGGLVRGSVGQRLVRTSPVSVLIVRGSVASHEMASRRTATK
jgi:nucleotide-binding universal stress UspA family protein